MDSAPRSPLFLPVLTPVLLAGTAVAQLKDEHRTREINERNGRDDTLTELIIEEMVNCPDSNRPHRGVPPVVSEPPPKWVVIELTD